MNKNIKKITAMTLAVCAVSGTEMIKGTGLLKSGAIPVYAADSDSLNLEGLYLSKGDIDFSSDVTSYKVYLNKGVKEIEIGAPPEGSKKRISVKIKEEGVSDDENYRHTFKLSVGENVFDIVVEDKNDESRKKTYTLTVYRGTDENGEDIEQDLYIDYLTINGEELSLSKDKKVYDYKVDASVKEAKVVIEPDQNYYTVKINNDKTYENEERIKRTFTLEEGKNEIKIKLTDGEDDERKQRTYTVNIYRGVDIPKTDTTNSSASNVSNDNSNKNTTSAQGNTQVNNTSANTSVTQTSESGKWQQNSNGKWFYLDKNGNLAKNTWFFVQGDGTIATGWISFGGHWYYLNNEGVMTTGWQKISEKWYYLGEDGIMKTGWIELGDKWYYLNSDGSMAANTTISGYKLGSDGAWIK